MRRRSIHCRQPVGWQWAAWLSLAFALLTTISSATAFAEDVKVGLLVGKSSILAEEAAQIANGVDLAQREIAASSSKKFHLVALEKDTNLNPDEASRAFLEFAKSAEKIHYVIGPQSSAEVSQVAPLAKSTKTVLITPSARSDDILALNEYVFRTRHSQEQECKFFAPYILSQTQRGALHTIILDSFAGYALARAFKGAFESIGGIVGTFQDLGVDRPDYAEMMRKLKINRAAYLYVASLSVQVADLMLETNEAGLHIRFFGNSDNQGQIIITRAGALAEGFTFPYAFDPDGDDNSGSFARKYMATYHQPATQAAANAYDAAMILSLCLEKVGNDVDSVKSCLFYIRDYPGAGGPLSMDRNGGAKRRLIIKGVRNGEFVKM